MRIARLMYTSTASAGMDDRKIRDILSTARIANAKLGVTGLLVYAAGHFMQLLEGPEQAVGSVFDRIMSDRRHDNITVLMTDRHGRREFPDWAMGYELIESASLPRGSGWFQLSQDSMHAALPETVSPEVRLLFTSFYGLKPAALPA